MAPKAVHVHPFPVSLTHPMHAKAHSPAATPLTRLSNSFWPHMHYDYAHEKPAPRAHPPRAAYHRHAHGGEHTRAQMV